MSRRRICCCTGEEPPPPPDVMPERAACNIQFPSLFPARSYTFSVSGSIQALAYGINVPSLCEPGSEFIAHTDCSPRALQQEYITYAPDCNPEDPQCRSNSKAVGTSSYSGTMVIAGGTNNGGICNSERPFISSVSTVSCGGSDTVIPLLAIACDQEFSSSCVRSGACYNTSTIVIFITAGDNVTYSQTDQNCDVTSQTVCLTQSMECTYQRRKSTTDTWMAEGVYYLVKLSGRQINQGGGCTAIPDLCGSVTSPISRSGVPSTITVTGF